MANQQRLAIKAIEQLFSQPATLKPVENTDLAQYILSRSYGGASKTTSTDLAAKQGAESEGPSLLSKTFDLLSTGLYGTANVASDLAQAVHDAPKNNPGGNPITSILQGMEAGAKSIGKNTIGTLARSTGDVLDIGAQISGLDSMPLVGGLENKVESGLLGTADKLTPRKMGSEILGEQFGVKNKLARYGGGFAADVAMDPITYVPGLDIISIMKKAKEAKRASQGFRSAEDIAKDSSTILDDAAATGQKPVTEVMPGSSPTSVNPFVKPTNPVAMPPTAEMGNLIPPATTEIPKAALPPSISNKPSFLQTFFRDTTANPENVADLKVAQRIDNAKRAANVRWGKPIDWHDIPEMTREEKSIFSEMGRQGKMAKKGIVSDGKGPISIPATNQVLENIRQGIIPRFGPVPMGAEGAAADHAVAVAEKAASNLSKSARKGLPKDVLTPADQVNLFNSSYNRAAQLVNDNYARRVAERAAKPLTPKQDNAVNEITGWINGEQAAGRNVSKAEVKDHLDTYVANKVINKTDHKVILKKLFPSASEPIRNFAATKFGKTATEQLARQMLKTAEDHLISKGIQPIYWNGMRVRLSDVLEEVGAKNSMKYASEIMDAFVTKNTNKLIDPEVAHAVSTALARRSMATSDMLSSLSEKTLQVKSGILDKYKYPTPTALREMNRLPEQAAETAKSMGATSVEAKAISDHIQTLIDSNRLPEEVLFDRLGRETAQKLLNQQGTLEEIQKGSTLVSKLLDETSAQAAKDPTAATAHSGFMARISMWYGRPEIIKQFSNRAFSFSEVNASKRALYFRNASKQFTKEQLHRGYNLARTPENLRLVNEGLESDPGVISAAAMFKDYFDWMLGSQNFDKLSDLAGVVAVRSNMIATDLNRHMAAVGSSFRFDTGFVKKALTYGGKDIPRDYTPKGLGWMQSWERHDPVAFGQDPLSFMYDVDLAIQRTTAEYATFDEFARRYGAKVGDTHYNSSIHKAIIPNPRLAGYRFHPEVQQDMLRLIKDLETGSWRPTSPMMRHIVQATRIWKSSVTIYRPIHHEKNVIGDAFNMWLAGHNDPRDFNRAIKVLASQKSKYPGALRENDMDAMKGLLDENSLALLSKPTPEAKASDVIIHKRGIKVTSENLWASGFKRGIFKDYNVIEDLIGNTTADRLLGPSKSRYSWKSPFGGKAHDTASKISEHREHFVRMAHYIAAVRKGIVKSKGQLDLEKIYDDAATEIQKYHPDGSDLTQFEQKLRIVIPFYSWTRKEIPLLVQAMVQRPAKIVAIPRAQRTLAGMSGINVNEDQGMLDPYPDDQLFPDWIRASGIGPIGDPSSDNPVARFWASFGATTNGFNGPEGYVSINPSNPFNDVTTQLFGFGNPDDSMRGVVNSMNPALQIPMSLAFDKTFSGAPIQKANGGQGVTDYLLRQIPQIGEFSRITGAQRNDKPDVEGRTKQNLINFLTGMGVLGTGPYQKSAEFEAKARARNAASGN